MKKHLSVFGLFVRASLVPMIILFLLTAAVQAGMFFFELLPYFDAIHPDDGGYIPGLETIFSRTFIPHTALAALILLTALLCVQGSAFSSRCGYTMSRLSVTEESSFLWQAGYNSLAFLLFWAIEGVLMFTLCAVYAANIINATGQTALLAAYRDEFLHSILPLHDVSRIVRNAVFCITLGTMTAYYTYTQRSGKASVVLVPAVVYAVGAFRMGDISLSGDIVHIIICLFFTAAVIVKVLTGFNFLYDQGEEENAWKS